MFVLAWAGDVYAAMPAEIHLVFWSGSTTDKSEIDALFGCLTGSSTFATTWAAQFGLAPVTFASSNVLQAAAPATVDYQSNLETFMKDAFTKGLLPAPKKGVANEYILYWPAGTSVTASGGGQTATLCQGFGSPCGVHDSFQLANGVQYDVGSVPLSCNACPGLDGETAIGLHEAAEGIADFGQANLGSSNPFEVGDSCEGSQQNYTSLACCGKTFTVQQLSGRDSAGNQTSCQTIKAAGVSCACVATGAACSGGVACCSGFTCDSSTSTCVVPSVDAGSGSSSSSGGGSSSSGSSSGSSSSSGGGSSSGSSSGGGSGSGSSSSGSSSGGSSSSGSSSSGGGSSGGSSSGADAGSSSSGGGRVVDGGAGPALDGGSDGSINGFDLPPPGSGGCGCKLAPDDGARDPRGAVLVTAVAFALWRRRRRRAW